MRKLYLVSYFGGIDKGKGAVVSKVQFEMLLKDCNSTVSVDVTSQFKLKVGIV